MSEIIIVLLLLVPVIVVIAVLNHSHKKRKQKAQEKLSAYLQQVIEQTAVSPTYQKQLVHQLLTVDEKNRMVLIIDYRDSSLSHDVFSLDDVESIKVFHHKGTVMEGEKPETFTTQIGVVLTLEKTEAEKFLTLYDHVEHNIYHMAELEREAAQLQQRIVKAKNGKPVTT